MMMMANMRLLLLHVAASLAVLGYTADAAIACNSTHNPCEELLFPGSECRNGVCSNPFEKGCLQAMANANPQDYEQKKLASLLASRLQIRVCNSDDPPDAAARGLCLDRSQSSDQRDELYARYQELRILSQNWESVIFSSWIAQIVLSELLQVPVTIESGMNDTANSFYDPLYGLNYNGATTDWRAMERANQHGCTKARHEQGAYQPCGHTFLEFWNGNMADMERELGMGTIEPIEGLGAIGQQAIFVTKFTAEADPTILNLHGIQGEGNRRKLAETFKRPTTWRDYCEQESPTNCTVPDDVAQRPPLDELEEERMHVKGLYTGHFRMTDSNDCDANPTTCTGHIADFPCGWISFVIPQMYHLDVALSSDGKEAGSRGYTYQQLSDMWAAANATKNNLMTMWWTPEALHSTYLGSQSEMQKISLTWPTQACFENRITNEQRCASENILDQVGDPVGACDEAPQLLHKIIASSLYTTTHADGISEARRSPAYDTIKAFKMSELQLGDILKTWIMRDVDKHGFDPRLATCQWVWDNLPHIESFIPRSYPRVAEEKPFHEDPLLIFALVLGVIGTLLVIGTTIFTYIRRDCYAIMYAQVEFVFLLLLGLFLNSIGAMVLVMEASPVTCIISSWLLLLGYTTQLVSLLIKVSAIHKLTKAAQRLRRLVLPKPQLFGTLALINGLVVVYLTCWVVLDPRKPDNQFFVTGEVNEDGATLVSMVPYCKSNSEVWDYVNICWVLFQLALATLLAFRTRNIREEFNESKSLGMSVYSHFLFIVILVATLLFRGALREAYLVGIRSIIYTTDTIVALLIYFLPKFTAKPPASISRSSLYLTAQVSSNNLVADNTELREQKARLSTTSTALPTSSNMTSQVSFNLGASDRIPEEQGAQPNGSSTSTTPSVRMDPAPEDRNKDELSFNQFVT